MDILLPTSAGFDCKFSFDCTLQIPWAHDHASLLRFLHPITTERFKLTLRLQLQEISRKNVTYNRLRGMRALTFAFLITVNAESSFLIFTDLPVLSIFAMCWAKKISGNRQDTSTACSQPIFEFEFLSNIVSNSKRIYSSCDHNRSSGKTKNLLGVGQNLLGVSKISSKFPEVFGYFFDVSKDKCRYWPVTQRWYSMSTRCKSIHQQ